MRPSRRSIGLQLRRGIAEAQTSFDGYRGGPRNHDLLIEADTASGPVAISVEAKVDESFDRTLAEVRADARRTIDAGRSTNAAARLDGLLDALVAADRRAAVADTLRYQLFAATARTLAAAKEQGAGRAVLVLHIASLTTEADKERVERNHDDLDAFLAALWPGATQRSGPAGWITGELRVPGNKQHIPAHVPLHIASLTTALAP